MMRTPCACPVLLVVAALASLGAFARPAPQQEADFKSLVAEIAAERQSGQEENATLFEHALSLLDRTVLAGLNAPGEPNLEEINKQLGQMVERQPAVGEEYKLHRLGGKAPAFALVANFGVSGPSAVRLYSPFAAPRYKLVARVDRFTQKDFFDDYMALIPVEAFEPMFVTVTGRTDDLKSGAFTAWRLSGDKVAAVWSTDILPQSSYEATPGGIRLTYCADFAEDRPRDCRRMSRERFAWDGSKWQRVEQQNVPIKSSPK
jgi:hypothetical protein